MKEKIDMNKVVKMRTKSDNVLEFLDEAKEHVEENNIDNIMIVMKIKGKDSHVMTGYCNLDVFDKQELLSHIQVDIMRDYIEANYVTP